MESGNPGWLAYVGVDDINASTEKARALGATIHVGPHEIPNVGWFTRNGQSHRQNHRYLPAQIDNQSAPHVSSETWGAPCHKQIGSGDRSSRLTLPRRFAKAVSPPSLMPRNASSGRIPSRWISGRPRTSRLFGDGITTRLAPGSNRCTAAPRAPTAFAATYTRPDAFSPPLRPNVLSRQDRA